MQIKLEFTFATESATRVFCENEFKRIMNPITFAGQGSVLKAPEDWDDEMGGSCVELPIAHCDGSLISCWEPTWRERFRLLFLGVVWVYMAPASHPPIAVQAGGPPRKPQKTLTPT